mmetsp:Transcript_9289/g.25276  ORF Transcript_9289/g.25276 Transcript_9289/m.25276 type:complete len:80 (-) Transcript_9289:1825-2064(-)
MYVVGLGTVDRARRIAVECRAGVRAYVRLTTIMLHSFAMVVKVVTRLAHAGTPGHTTRHQTPLFSVSTYVFRMLLLSFE